MKRRNFLTLLGGAAAWPVAAQAQQDGRVRRVGVFMNLAADDPEGQAHIAAFLQGLQELGWLPAAMCRSTTAGARETPNVFANLRQK
jgi:putative tryptophan/tyrosine transport system substrate-binding protein